jgi:hypothetical protein
MIDWEDIRRQLRLDYLLLFILAFGLIRVALYLIPQENNTGGSTDALLATDLISVSGEVTVWKNGSAIDGSKGMELGSGDSIVTRNGIASLRFPDGSTARISENSSFFLKKINPRHPELLMRTGQVRMERTLWNWTLHGPKGTVTTGRTTSQDDEATSLGLVMRVGKRVSIAVYEGIATWKTDGKTFEIPAGKAVVLTRNEQLPTTIDIPEIPVIESPESGSTYTMGLLRLGVPIVWSALQKADFYRIEIKRIDDTVRFAPRFESTQSKTFTLRNLTKGTYTLRVLASDEFGMESDWSKVILINVAERIFDITPDYSGSPKITFRSIKTGNFHVIGGKITGLDPFEHCVLIYQLDGSWKLQNKDSDFRVPIDPDGYFEAAVPEAARVALGVVSKTATNLPVVVSYGQFPPEKDNRFLLHGIYRL